MTFHARATVFEKRLRDFLDLDDDGFRALFAKSPIKRIKRPRFLRNVCVALGNTGTPEDLPALERAAVDPEPLIAEHAAWAIQHIRKRSPDRLCSRCPCKRRFHGQRGCGVSPQAVLGASRSESGVSVRRWQDKRALRKPRMDDRRNQHPCPPL